MELFERQWQTYRSIVDHDWMEHRGVTGAAAQALRTWLDLHPERRGEARLLDLGCGDLALMATVFASLPLKSYVGVDLTEQVLPLARAALGAVPFGVEFHHADVSTFIETLGAEVDLVHAALVLHHLSDEQKGEFLSVLRGCIRQDGAFVWADVFREPGESRADYVTRYAARIRGDWCEIDDSSREAIVTHMSTFDFPADREAIVAVARRAGWNWEWLWHGRHRAEAVALLTPAW